MLVVATACQTSEWGESNPADRVGQRSILARTSVDASYVPCLELDDTTLCTDKPDRHAYSIDTRRQERSLHSQLVNHTLFKPQLLSLAETLAEFRDLHRLPSAEQLDLSAAFLRLAHSGDPSQAARAADLLLSTSPDDPLATRRFFNLGLAFRELGLLVPANHAFEEAITTAPIHDGWTDEASARLWRPPEIKRLHNRERALMIGLDQLLSAETLTGTPSSLVLTSIPADHTWPGLLDELTADIPPVDDRRKLLSGLRAYRNGEYRQAATQLESVLPKLASWPHLEALTRLYWLGAILFDRPPDDIRHELNQLVEEATASHRGWVATYGARLLAVLNARTRHPLDTLDTTRRALTLANDYGYTTQKIEIGLLRAETFATLQRLDQAWGVAARALHDAYELGSSDELFFALNLATGIAETQGLDRLASHLQTLAIHQASSQSARDQATAYLWRGYFLDRLGESADADLAQARELAADVVDLDEREELIAEIQLFAASTIVRSDPQTAIEQLKRALPILESRSLDNHQRALHLLARARRHSGQLDLAAARLAEAIELAIPTSRSGQPGDWTLDDQVSYQSEIARWCRELADLELERQRPWHALAANERWKLLSIDHPESLSATDVLHRISARVRADQAIVAFGHNDDSVFAWIIRSPSRESRWVPLGPKAELDELLRQYERLRTKRSRHHATKETLVDLDTWLIRPLQLDDITELTIVPDPGLEHIPFPRLRDQDDQRLIERVLLRYTFATGDLLRTSGEPIDPHPLTGNGLILSAPHPPVAERFEAEPLTHAQDEAETIASLVAGRARIHEVTDLEATTTSLLEHLPTADWVHLIGHTTPGPLPIIPPALMLYPDDHERHWVTAADIAGLDLSHLRFVILSTCSSAVRGPDGWMSRSLLARGFLEAGASGVVASLTPVGDRESAELVRLMYRQLDAGVAVAEALRRAQIELVETSPDSEDTALSFVFLGHR